MDAHTLARSGRAVAVLVTVLAALAAVTGILVFTQGRIQSDAGQTVLLHQVTRSDFQAFVTEPGDVASSSNIEIRCRVRSPGAPGAPILKICDEGAQVAPGDFLVQFDDSALQNDLLGQRIVVANDKALLIQAQSDLANAKRTLLEFQEGLSQQELELLEGEAFLAEEEFQRSKTSLAYGEQLAANGFITEVQLRAEQFSVEKARKNLAAAKRKLQVYRNFTQEKTDGEYQAEIKKQEANVEAATFTLELSRQKLGEIEEQIAHCLVTAPASGQVVHANDRDGRGDTPSVIEEGTMIRENQIVIRLPDLEHMQVDVKINESHVNHIKAGQPAEIQLDADPDNVLLGRVKSVAPYPFPMRWHGAPLEYGAVIEILDPPASIRPGLRAKVKIVYQSRSQVLQVPLPAVVENGEQHFCLVQAPSGWRARPIQIGEINNTQVIVESGLAEGDQVALAPFRHIKRSDLPELQTDRRDDLLPESDSSEAAMSVLGAGSSGS